MFPTLLAALALSAPVPKLPPTLADVFGEPTAFKGDCSLEMDKGRKLTVTVPPTHPRCEGSSAGQLQPMAAKPVQGDFVLTVRLAVDVPDDADTGVSPDRRATCAGCGVAVRSEGNPDLGVVVAAERERRVKGWGLNRRVSYTERTSGGDFLAIHSQYTDGGAGAETHLRLTRTGEKLKVEWSADGLTWKGEYSWKMRQLEGRVTVGPVAYQTTDKPLTATFEEYKLQPAKK